jgi:hypothetical protein
MIALTKRVLYRQVGLIAVLAGGALLCGLLFGYQPIERMSPGVLAWWSGLCIISIFNICVWRYSVLSVAEQSTDTEPTIFRFQRRQLVLAAVFVIGCAFRSLMPRGDVQRIGIVDSWLSSVLVGRSVATVAELCFAAQWALVLNMLAWDARSRWGLAVSWLLVPFICAAETCSWYAVLTTDYIGNAIEQSIWTLCAMLVIASFLAMWSRSRRTYRPFLATAALLGACYIAFMCGVDIPMYLTRWQADEANARPYLTLRQGIWDVASRWVVTHSWDEWHPEMPWMSLYFSVCVWCSLALAHVPRAQEGGTDEARSAV